MIISDRYHRVNQVKFGEKYSIKYSKHAIRRLCFILCQGDIEPTQHYMIMLESCWSLYHPHCRVKKRCISLMYQPMGAHRQIGIPWNLPQNVNLKKAITYLNEQ